jgi:pimeloyl-ACP methyl ester carboxylesterase
MADKIANVVLVHGGFVDGSGWQSVYDLLTADGYRVSVVQNPKLIAGFPSDGPIPPILPPQQGFLFLDREKFHHSFAGDLADAQVPWGVDAPAGAITKPAWQNRSSWYLLTTQDLMIPPGAQRAMSERAGSTVVEVSASHAVYVSQPAAVADLIKQAATA